MSLPTSVLRGMTKRAAPRGKLVSAELVSTERNFDFKATTSSSFLGDATNFPEKRVTTVSVLEALEELQYTHKYATLEKPTITRNPPKTFAKIKKEGKGAYVVFFSPDGIIYEFRGDYKRNIYTDMGQLMVRDGGLSPSIRADVVACRAQFLQAVGVWELEKDHIGQINWRSPILSGKPRFRLRDDLDPARFHEAGERARTTKAQAIPPCFENTSNPVHWIGYTFANVPVTSSTPRNYSSITNLVEKSTFEWDFSMGTSPPIDLRAESADSSERIKRAMIDSTSQPATHSTESSEDLESRKSVREITVATNSVPNNALSVKSVSVQPPALNNSDYQPAPTSTKMSVNSSQATKAPVTVGANETNVAKSEAFRRAALIRLCASKKFTSTRVRRSTTKRLREKESYAAASVPRPARKRVWRKDIDIAKLLNEDYT